MSVESNESKVGASNGRSAEAKRWQRLQNILADALQESSPGDRAAYIERCCANDTTLRRDAKSLLAEAEIILRGTPDPLEECADHGAAILRGADEDETDFGRRIGAYMVVRQLGRGGMGTVYLAKRADGTFEKEVAIKLLKRGTDTGEILRRFRTERQILARLDHPNVARLLDAGTTDDGLPYFVLDYVDGVPISRFVAERKLPIRERLALFLKICAAVEAAHRCHIVHRDLKPSNILVNAEGEPKLLDFGIAKLVAPGEDTLEATATAQQRFTPICASPEQARGERVTTAADIYALGALLYELLTEQTPHRFSNSHPSTEELARVICQQEPDLPSHTVFGRERQQQLRGDLDNIVLSAMRKEPERRYASVGEFAEDIRRYLDKQPVRARPNPGGYLVRRFVRRNSQRLGAIAATSVRSLRYAFTGQSAHSIPGKSVAVLPFENLSVEKENAFFTNGVQDEILTELAKVAELKVISRTSVQKYQSGMPRNLREIGQQLGVAHVLEGSVQRIANRVRVTAQLVDVNSHAQLWAERYDRDLADVFAIQSEIAQAIAVQLRAKLSPQEKADIENRPTRDLAAYDLYLQAKENVNSYLDASDPGASLRQAVRMLDEATQRDPNFTLAYCYAARAHTLLYALNRDPSEARVRLAEHALQTALRLQPASAEAHLARADYLYGCYLNFTGAEKELEIARPGLPNSTPFYVLAANIYRRQARWDEAEGNFAKAVELDPRNANSVNYLADTQILMRKFSDAKHTYERARVVGLDPPILLVRIAIIEFAATGSTKPLKAALAAAPPDLDVGGGETPLRILTALVDRDYEGAYRALGTSPRIDFQDVDFSFYYPRSWYGALIARAEGDHEKAKTSFAAARSILEERMKTKPSARTQAVLAQVYAALELNELAIREANQAVEVMPIARDAYEGPLVLQSLAQVYIWTGQKDQALGILERLIRLPGYLSYGYLRVDAAWDPLRGDSRYEKIVTSLAPQN